MSQARGYRITLDISDKFRAVAFSIYKKGFKPSLKDVPDPFVTVVEISSVRGVEKLYATRKLRQRGFNQEVVVIRHQSVSMHLKGVSGAADADDLQEFPVVGSGAEDIASRVAPRHDVIKCAGHLKAKGTGHKRSLL